MKNYVNFYQQHETAQPYNERLKIFIKIYKNYRKKNVKKMSLLDIGCGKKAVLSHEKENGDIYYGCDIYKKIDNNVNHYLNIDLNSDDLSKKYMGKFFDIVFCGEVIEHVFSPDKLLEEIKNVMNANSILILSTPNLGYYLNRIMLLFGLSPFFLENSSEFKLGRKFSFLGQGYPTQGHIRVFTYQAMIDLLNIKGFRIIKVIPVRWGPFIDHIFNIISPSLAPNNVFIIKKENA